MDKELLWKYARLVVKTGLNLQKGQILVILAPTYCADFVRIVTETAFKCGAKDVVVDWRDEKFEKIRYKNAPDDVFDSYPEWQKLLYTSNAEKNASFLAIAADDPGLLADVNPQRLSRSIKAKDTALESYMERLMSNRNTWCVMALPAEPWAVKVFPGLPVNEAVGKLSEAIIKAVRADTNDPVAAWQEHLLRLKRNMDFMNSHRFKYLHYRNSIGTDLIIELPENHMWLGGSDYTPEGVEFIANMPTEEIYTLPAKNGVNGIAVGSMPLNYNGNIIENFRLEFQNGRITGYSAEKGLETLKTIIGMDEGSHYLGEVALVPGDSPISKSKILFYNTLFDENASCHLAIGKAYPTCLKGSECYGREELEKAGVNDSLVHVDFMIGTEDLDIMGVKASGEEVPVFKHGRFI